MYQWLLRPLILIAINFYPFLFYYEKEKQLFIAAMFSFFLVNCTKSSSGGNLPASVVPVPATPPVIGTNDMDFWLTKNDQSVLLQKQTGILSFGNTVNTNPVIEVDTTQIMQTVDGFGFTLTGGSAALINNLSTANKANLLQELFGTGSGSIGLSYLRISIGASDLSATTFTYDDQVAGQPVDSTLKNFNLNAGDIDLIP